jgi:hypothetical protein
MNPAAAPMDTYLVIGNSNTRKASVVRSLTGCFNRSLRDIQLANRDAPLRLYARVGALQESKTSAADFQQEVAGRRCGAVICCLWPSANPLDPMRFPGAEAYLEQFIAAGWTIRRIAVLGQNAGGIRSPLLRQFPQASTDPINLTAQQVRMHFGWC